MPNGVCFCGCCGLKSALLVRCGLRGCGVFAGRFVSPFQGSSVRELVGCAGTQGFVLGCVVPPLRGWGARIVEGADVLALNAAGRGTKGARTLVRSRCGRA